MAPKRRTKVVGSVVKTKVVQETVQVSTAVVADHSTEPEALLTVDVSGSTVVQVEVACSDGDATGTATTVKPRKGRRSGQDMKPPQEEAPWVVPQSQEETQDPNEEPKKRQEVVIINGLQEKQPETPSKRECRPKQQGSKGGVGAGDAGMGGVGGYKRYMWRVLKQVHPDMGAPWIGGARHDDDRHVRAPGRRGGAALQVHRPRHAHLVLPGELGKHAVSEGTKAMISKFMSAA